MSELNNPENDVARPKPAAVAEQLQRILSSQRFADSPRLSSFLRFIVEAKLSGDDDRIQEYIIGVEVFDRGESFDPRLDSIVRVEARRLRDRLAEYYAGNGVGDPVAIELPRRGYVPEFTNNGHIGQTPGARNESGPLRFLGNPKVAWAVAATAIAGCALLLLRSPTSPPADTVAIELQPPPGGSLLTPYRGGGPAAAPDSSRFVYAARDAGGATFLYLRSLDRARPERLEGTENAIWPFWSPDGEKIGFGALQELKILDLGREEVRKVADAPRYLGGTWSDADGGVIVIAQQRGPLLRIPVAGGTFREALPLGEGERSHREPAFLPDGKRFLYRSNRSDGHPEIRFADLDSGESRLLFESDSTAKYVRLESARDVLLFRDGASLLASEIDPETLALTSPPRTLATGLPLAGGGAFSATAETLAYFHGPYPISRGRLVWRSRTGSTLGTLGDPDNYMYISLSPDERTVAAGISTDFADVWTIDIATGVATRLTEHPMLDRCPTWSPDSRKLLISTNRHDGGRLYVLSADGSSKPEPWLDYPPDGDYSDWPSHWHPASSTVLFSRRAEGGHDVWEKRPGASPRSLIRAAGSQRNARLSPGQRHVAYVSNELGERQIFLSTYPSTGSRIRISPDGGNYPLWNGDGSELFYIAPDGNVMAVEIRADKLLSASLPRPLFRVQFPVSPSSTIYQYAVKKDGERFLVVEELESPSATAILNWERLLDR